MPSNLRSNSQSAPVKRSWVSVAAIGSSHSGMFGVDMRKRVQCIVWPTSGDVAGRLEGPMFLSKVASIALLVLLPAVGFAQRVPEARLKPVPAAEWTDAHREALGARA